MWGKNNSSNHANFFFVVVFFFVKFAARYLPEKLCFVRSIRSCHMIQARSLFQALRRGGHTRLGWSEYTGSAQDGQSFQSATDRSGRPCLKDHRADTTTSDI